MRAVLPVRSITASSLLGYPAASNAKPKMADALRMMIVSNRLPAYSTHMLEP